MYLSVPSAAIGMMTRGNHVESDNLALDGRFVARAYNKLSAVRRLVALEL